MMEQNFDLFRWLSGNLRRVFLPQKLFCQYDPECDRGIDKTWGSISALSPSVGGSFSRTAAYNRAKQDLGARKNLPSRCLCLGQIVMLVLACVHTTHPPLGEAAPSPIFPERRGSVHRLFSVCALGRLSFQFRIPTKPLLSLKWVHSVIDFATLKQVTAG